MCTVLGKDRQRPRLRFLLEKKLTIKYRCVLCRVTILARSSKMRAASCFKYRLLKVQSSPPSGESLSSFSPHFLNARCVSEAFKCKFHRDGRRGRSGRFAPEPLRKNVVVRWRLAFETEPPLGCGKIASLSFSLSLGVAASSSRKCGRCTRPRETTIIRYWNGGKIISIDIVYLYLERVLNDQVNWQVFLSRV